MPCRGAWPHLKEVDAEFGKQGLRVLALSDEEQSAVEPYVDQMDLPFLVASGSSSGDAYGVTGIPHTFLIDAQGTLVWEGSPGDLSKVPITFFKVPSTQTVMHSILQGPDGNIWYTKLAVNKVGKLLLAR